jgi:hypothetical protein
LQNYSGGKEVFTSNYHIRFITRLLAILVVCGSIGGSIGGSIAGSIICQAAAASSPARAGQDFFPLVKGNCWIFEGPTKWITADLKTPVATRVLRSKMEITDVTRHGKLVVAKVTGHPGDLSWYEEGQKPGAYYIVRKNDRYFYLLIVPSDEDSSNVREREMLIARMNNSRDQLADLLERGNLFLELPLRTGKRFGDPEQLTREDRMYCWVVESIEAADLGGVSGIAKADTGNARAYNLEFNTNPDSTRVQFVPGVGITKYSYVHHGTVAETDLVLVECKLHSETH